MHGLKAGEQKKNYMINNSIKKPWLRYIISLTLISLTLTACQSASKGGAHTAGVALTTQQLQTAQINVIQQGSRLTLWISTDAFFDPASTDVKPERVKTLQQMAQFVQNYANRYPGAPINVDGYTDQVFNLKTQQQLSQEYAAVISSYLWNQGIPSSRLQTRGHGSQGAIASQTTVRGAALNRRVQITIN